METYYINTLIFFLKNQQEINFKGIDQLLAIIDNPSLPDKMKRKMIFQILRFYGLNETTYKDGKFDYGDMVPLKATPTKNIEDIIPIKVDVIKFRVINGEVELAIPIN